MIDYQTRRKVDSSVWEVVSLIFLLFFIKKKPAAKMTPEARSPYPKFWKVFWPLVFEANITSLASLAIGVFIFLLDSVGVAVRFASKASVSVMLKVSAICWASIFAPAIHYSISSMSAAVSFLIWPLNSSTIESRLDFISSSQLAVWTRRSSAALSRIARTRSPAWRVES